MNADLERGRRRRRTLGGALVVACGGVLIAAAAAHREAGAAPTESPSAAGSPARTASDGGPAWTDVELRRILSHGPLPAASPDPTNRLDTSDTAAMFGRQIFYDDRFSVGRLMSCASCHLPDRAFADARRRPVGNHPSRRHTPSLLDSGHQRWIFWDGRADSLWSQALDPFEDLFELRSNRVRVVKTISADRALRRAYERAIGPMPAHRFLNGLPDDATPLRGPDDPHRVAWDAMSAEAQDVINRTFADLGKAIAAFERRLVAGPSAFDRYLESLRDGGDGDGHLSPAAERGLRLFIGDAGCRVCHAGPRFSDGAFHATGVFSILPGAVPDPGRYAGLPRLRADIFGSGGRYSDDPEGTKATIVARTRSSSGDFAAFRTPSLRHVAATGPYMHGGQFTTLEEVVRFYSTLENAERYDHHGQAVLEPLDLEEQEIVDLVAFLESLTGTRPPAPWGVDPRPADARTTGDGAN